MFNTTLRRQVAPILLLIGAGVPAHAERVYHLVDYPALQNGHTLSGTITTTDDAPADGILKTAEILDWHWSITGQNPYSAYYNPSPPTGLTTNLAQNIAISASIIGLPMDAAARLYLNHFPMTGAPPGSIELFLSWQTFLNNQGTYASSSALQYPARDTQIPIWTSFLTSPSNIWLVAVAIPEPSIFISLLLLIVTACNTRRSRRPV